ncbi:MAG: nucleotidyltransferase domain-containing protein [Nanoarchaeota archaeon]
MTRRITTKIEKIQEIADEISKAKNVEAVYLFGSYASEKNTPLSDIDLCIIGNLNEKEKNKAFEFLSDNLDISLFNDLPIIIKSRVLKEGKLLAVKNIKFLHKLKIKTFREYLDFKHIINRYCQEVLKCTI